jgi:hypothetical protein
MPSMEQPVKRAMAIAQSRKMRNVYFMIIKVVKIHSHGLRRVIFRYTLRKVCYIKGVVLE